MAAATLALAVAVAGIGFAIWAFGGASQPPKPRPAAAVENGKIAFVATGHGQSQYEIYTVNPDGSDLSKLGDGRDPAWSPDGSRLAFTINGPSLGIALMNADGTGRTELTHDVAYAQSPSWSPDGTKIAFAAQNGIYVMSIDGTDIHRLAGYTGPLACADFEPSWSPDGTTIAWAVRCDGGGLGIWTVRPDGSGLSTVVDDGSGLSTFNYPTWSPDGTLLAFEGGRPVYGEAPGPILEMGIYVVGADGSGLTKLAEGTQPAWSPDGTKIAFLRDLDLFVMSEDGSLVTQVTSGRLASLGPAWQPVPTGQVSPSPSEPPPSPAPSAEVGQRIEVGQASAVLYADGSVWVDLLRDARTSTGTVLRIDEGSGEILARIPVDAFPDLESGGGGMAYDGRFVWIVGTSSPVGGSTLGILVRIDPETNEAARFDLNVATAGTDLVFDGQDLWTTATSSPGKPLVLQIEPGSGRIIAEIPFEAEWWGSLVVVDGAIWVTEMSVKNYTVQGDLTLVRLDPATGADMTRVPFGSVYGIPASTSPVAGGGAIWAGAGDRLLRIDPQTGDVTAQIPASIGLDLEYADDGSIWFLRTWDALQRLDPTIGKIDITVQLDRKPIPVAVAVGPGAVWVLDYGGGLTRVGLT